MCARARLRDSGSNLKCVLQLIFDTLHILRLNGTKLVRSRFTTFHAGHSHFYSSEQRRWRKGGKNERIESIKGASPLYSRQVSVKSPLSPPLLILKHEIPLCLRVAARFWSFSCPLPSPFPLPPSLSLSLSVALLHTTLLSLSLSLSLSLPLSFF